ncbi:MAG: hypothetical protein ACR2NO_06865 [Chloroflexota bacterium]
MTHQISPREGESSHIDERANVVISGFKLSKQVEVYLKYPLPQDLVARAEASLSRAPQSSRPSAVV